MKKEPTAPNTGGALRQGVQRETGYGPHRKEGAAAVAAASPWFLVHAALLVLEPDRLAMCVGLYVD